MSNDGRQRVQRGPRRFPDGGGKTEQPKNHGAVAEADVQLSHTLLEAAHRFRAGDHHLIGIRRVSDDPDRPHHRRRAIGAGYACADPSDRPLVRGVDHRQSDQCRGKLCQCLDGGKYHF